MSVSDTISKDPMMEMFIFESVQLIEQLEEILLDAEKRDTLTKDEVNEIFRIMHTIKGSSAMMMFSGISTLAHSLEDMFFFIRDNGSAVMDFIKVCDLVLAAVDCIKADVALIEEGNTPEAGHVDLEDRIKEYLRTMKDDAAGGVKTKQKNQPVSQGKSESSFSSSDENPDEIYRKYIARVYFEEDCHMENIRAYAIVHKLQDDCTELLHRPKDIINDNTSSEYISTSGFTMYFTSSCDEAILRETIKDALFLKDFDLTEVESYEAEILDLKENASAETETETDVEIKRNDSGGSSDQPEKEATQKNLKQSIINVSINKLDKLMDIVGEIVITEAMVTKNPDLKNLELDNFNKAARQLRKLTDELQDIVMSIRMLPIAATFHKMQRIVRDMSKKLGKDVDLVLTGEDTEVDKNIIDHLSDPLMHLIRNSLDHGIESKEERIKSGKSEKGSIFLEAKNAGGDVWVTIRDDGKGLNIAKIMQKAKDNGLLTKPESDYTEKEIFSFIMLPGFSTKENVSEFSGRGVGMDVVRENIEKLGGTILISSIPGGGTTIAIKMPLTLAIIDGMLIAVGKSRYIIPTTVIKESFRAESQQIIRDFDGNELIMLRGECFPVIRIHKKFAVETEVTELEKGIVIVVEAESNTVCLFADELVGEQQVVVKPIPTYIRKSKGLAGCTILGDGSICLILDVNGILGK